MSRPDGTPTNAVFGFVNILQKMLDGTDADCIAVVFDAGRKTFRNDIYPEYKANRSEPPPELVPQFALVREATRAFNVPAVESPGFEADDLIATYARLACEAGAEVTIVSSDKDLMQLVRPGVSMLDPITMKPIGEAEVREKFGVPPDKVVDVQALAGDSTDNVPGVPGIGVKTAAELINAYGNLDALLARAGEIKQPKRRETLLENKQKALLSRDLVRLRDDVKTPVPLAEFTVRTPDPQALRGFLQAQNFRSIIVRLEAGGLLPPSSEPAAEAPAQPTTPAPSAKAAGPAQYTLVTDMAALDDWIARAAAAGALAIDTETTSLDPMRAELVGISMAVEPGAACYIPLGHVDPDAPGDDDERKDGGLALSGGGSGKKRGKPPVQIDRKQALARLKPLLADPAVLKIGHNIKFDMHVFARHGLDMTPIDDTMLVSYVLEGGAHGHGMDELARLHLGHTTITYDEVTGTGKSRINFSQVPLDRARDYAAEDAEVTLRLHRTLKPRLVADSLVSVYETIERPLIPVVRAMEGTGIAVDRDELRRLSNDFALRLADLEAQIHKLAGRPFNVGSPAQLGKILFDEMGLSLPDGGNARKTKTGAYATGADVLEDLAAAGHDLPAKVLDWRQLAKLKSTYADALVEQIDPDTGRLHTSFAMAATSTGRLSSSDPNLQNIPVRGMDPMVRRQAKAINFGIIYGISAFGLARQLGIAQGEARAYIDAYFKRYPGIRAYMDRTKEIARKHGYVTTPFGRRCWTPEIAAKNPALRSFSERAAINAPLQGGAADIIKRAMVRIPAALARAGLKARMLLQVHDELLFEAPPGERDETIKVVKATMEGAAAPAVTLDVPLTVDVGHGRSWAEAH
ncbi:MAG: DNA polymerase I [Rhodospirillales bacterium]|nr:DNA polymerase I [Rhodospirillales bacterium]